MEHRVPGADQPAAIPPRLILSDGTHLAFDGEAATAHVNRARRENGRGDTPISFDEAMDLAGAPFAGYRIERPTEH